jgi:hypothetical protein
MSTSTTWYRAWLGKIDAHEVIAETAEFITLANNPKRREKKITEWSSWHPSREMAKAWLVEQAQAKVKRIEDELAFRREELAKAQAL